ncbi:MAG: protealysin inhibitor emfourin [Pseudomonadota bacterium]
MHIELVRTGGIAFFPGLNRPLVLDLECLEPAAAQHLSTLVEAADFFHLPACLGRAPPGAADCQSYRLTIEHAGLRHSVQATIPLQHPALAALIQAIEQYRRRGPPSAG